jgi:hypothetical protein
VLEKRRRAELDTNSATISSLVRATYGIALAGDGGGGGGVVVEPQAESRCQS